MDRFTRTADIIKAYYSYKQTADSATFVKKVCSFFDFIKDESLSDADLNLLLFLANEAGIPQYYDLLKSKFTNAEIGDESINSLTMSALFHDASLIRGDSKLHRYQKHVLDSFVATQRNRYVLTAPTSFGKTFLVYEIIQKMQYQNVLLIFPAISLLSENYARLCSWEAFSDYAIHSLSEEEFDITQKNIFIFTPERFLSFMDSHQHLHFNFAFIDEVYSLVTVLLSSYLEGGFMSMVDYYTTRRNPPKTKDEAIRTVADFVYNVFKYHLVKYLGLFDVFFRYRVSVLENVDMDSVPGLGLLMQKLEYNALSPTARKVSDYGVPFKLIDCYDSQAEYDKEQFDAYEKRVDEQVSRLFQ